MADLVIPSLDISTLVERPRVIIDGESFDMRHPDEFSLVEQLRLMRQARRLVELVHALTSDQSTDPTVIEAREREYDAIVNNTCRAVLLAPDDIHAKLREEHRVAISRAFTRLQSEQQRLRRTGANPETEEPATTGTSSSPDSPDSTAVTPSAG